MPSLDKHVLISLQTFSGDGQVQLCAKPGEGTVSTLKEFGWWVGRQHVPARRIKEVPSGQHVERDGEQGLKTEAPAPFRDAMVREDLLTGLDPRGRKCG